MARPVAGKVTVGPTYLDMLGTSGDFNGNTYNNFYSIPTPTSGNFSMTVELTSFTWVSEGQFDLLAFDDNSDYVKTDLGWFGNERRFVGQRHLARPDNTCRESSTAACMASIDQDWQFLYVVREAPTEFISAVIILLWSMVTGRLRCWASI